MSSLGLVPGQPALAMSRNELLIIAGAALVVLGLLVILIVRWRRARADRRYFDSLAGEASAPEALPTAAPFVIVLDDERQTDPSSSPARNLMDTSEIEITPASPSSDPIASPKPEEPARGPVTPLSQDASDAMAELDRLLGNTSD
jgi:hypothetical protein